MEAPRWPPHSQMSATRSVSRAKAAPSSSTDERCSRHAQHVAEAEKEDLALLDEDLLPVIDASSFCSRYGMVMKTASVLAGIAILASVACRGWVDHREGPSSLPVELFSSCEASCKKSSDASTRLLNNRDIQQRPLCRPGRSHHARRAASLSAKEKTEELESLLEGGTEAHTPSPKGSREHAKPAHKESDASSDDMPAHEESDASSDDMKTIQKLMQQGDQQDELRQPKAINKLEQFIKWQPQHKAVDKLAELTHERPLREAASAAAASAAPLPEREVTAPAAGPQKATENSIASKLEQYLSGNHNAKATPGFEQLDKATPRPRPSARPHPRARPRPRPRPVVPEDLGSKLKSETTESAEQKAQELAAMIAESDAKTTTTTTWHCIDVRPVLKFTIGVTVDDSVSALVDMMTPMFLRAYKGSVQRLLNTEEVFTHILAAMEKGSRRLRDLEGTIPAAVGKTFNIVAEVTDPSTKVVEVIENPDFPEKFRAAVRDEMNKQGAEEGMGSVQGMARFGKVEVVESNTNDIEGEFESMGFGTACRRSRRDLSFDAHHHTEVMKTTSLRTCSKICNMQGAKCRGFEFRNSEKRCELWKVPICYSAAPPEEMKGPHDFECFRKCQ